MSSEGPALGSRGHLPPGRPGAGGGAGRALEMNTCHACLGVSGEVEALRERVSKQKKEEIQSVILEPSVFQQ